MTHDEALAKARAHWITLEHDCDERARECECATLHAPGDDRCPNRAKHSACSYSQQSCDMLPFANALPEVKRALIDARLMMLQRDEEHLSHKSST